MSRYDRSKLALSRAHKRVLRGMVVDERSPGTVLHDFEAFLRYVEGRKLPVTAGRQLPLRVLPELNARLARPIELGLHRPQQKSYPQIHGLYLLQRASGLTCLEGTARKVFLVVDPAVRQAWNDLNPAERYGTLLETWLLRGHSQILGERDRYRAGVPEAFRGWQWFFLQIPDGGLPVAGNKDAEDSLRYRPGRHNLGLLDLFGLVSIRSGPAEPGKGWRIEEIERTPWGDALLALLHEGFFGEWVNIEKLDAEGRVPSGVLQPLLQPYLPAWKNNLSIPEWAFRDGTHVFRVSLGPIWRRIAMPAGQTLDALASAIVDAVEFTHDHLYQFSYRNRFGVEERVCHPYLEEKPFTSEVLIGDLPLRIGQSMIYLCDFGDQWEFAVTLEQVDPERAVDGPVVLEAHGEPPEQYPSWDDW